MRTVKEFLTIHRQAIRAAWPFDYSLLTRKRSLTKGQGKRSSQRGQIVFEFVLLLVVSITIATMVSKRLVNRDPEEPGFLIAAWGRISQSIGSDIID
jgi:hypothetical protein